MKLLFAASFSFLCNMSHAQKTTKYYDNNWMEVAAEKATYYANFIKTGDVYQCNSYWITGNNLRGKSTYPDTVMVNAVGTQVIYFKNGHVEDSLFNSGEKRMYLYHYYSNGQLAVHYYIPDSKEEPVVEAFDEDGKKLKNYIFEKEAEFKGGQKAWQEYIIKNVSKDIKIKGNGDIVAKVQVKFIVNKDGNVTAVAIAESSGYPVVDKDALRVIKESPEWRPAMQFNQPVNAYRIQPFVYQLKDEKNSSDKKKQ